MHHTATFPKNPLTQEPGTRYFGLDDDDSVPELGGTRPDRLAGVRKQERALRHTVEQTVDSSPGLPTLDVPVLQMVDQPVDVLHFFDTFSPVAEQVIDVPKIILEDIPMRTLVREPQVVEQLVEVPTVPQTVGPSILTLLQNFRPGGGGLPGFAGTASPGRYTDSGRRARPKDSGADRGGGGG